MSKYSQSEKEQLKTNNKYLKKLKLYNKMVNKFIINKTNLDITCFQEFRIT